MNRPLRIFCLVNAFEPDAPTRLMTDVAAGAQALGGWACLVAALRRTGPFEQVAVSRGLDTRFLGMQSAMNLAALTRLSAEIRAFRPDVFHAALVRPTLLGVPVARRCGVRRVVITQHGTHEWGEAGALIRMLMPMAFRRAARAADVVAAVSEATRRDLLAAGLPAAKLCVIPNGVDTETFVPERRQARADLLRSLGFPEESLLVGAAGNLREVKGHGVLVQAASLVHAREPRVRFVVWGEGPLRRSLEQAVLRANLSGRFVFPGRASDMAQAMASCDVFVQPSLRESFGLAAAEAMSAGVAVAASKTGGLAELVQDGVTGVLFVAGSAEALASSLLRLLSDAPLRARLGAAARQRVLEFYSRERMIRNYMSLYERLVAKD